MIQKQPGNPAYQIFLVAYPVKGAGPGTLNLFAMSLLVLICSERELTVYAVGTLQAR